MVEGELATADLWGAWRFVPADRASEDVLEYSPSPTRPPSTGPTPGTRSTCSSPRSYDDEGQIRGLLSVDSPRNGRLPGPEQLEVLTKYAGVARTLVLLALEREELNERVRMAERGPRDRAPGAGRADP